MVFVVGDVVGSQLPRVQPPKAVYAKWSSVAIFVGQRTRSYPGSERLLRRLPSLPGRVDDSFPPSAADYIMRKTSFTDSSP